jgi:hypothetical protein
MNFSEALKAMKMGNKVSREAWRGTVSCWRINSKSRLIEVQPDGQAYFVGDEIPVKAEDILAEDWWVVT